MSVFSRDKKIIAFGKLKTTGEKAVVDYFRMIFVELRNTTKNTRPE